MTTDTTIEMTIDVEASNANADAAAPTTTFNERYVEMGRHAPTRALLAQADTTVRHATTYKAPLVEHGLELTWYERIAALQAKVSAARGTQSEVRSQTKSSTISETTARAEGKALLRKLKNGVRLVFDDGPVDGVELDAFTSGKVGVSTDRILDRLDQLRPHVAKLDERLKRYFKGESALAQLNLAADNLRQASGTQAAMMRGAPLETRALYETQGELLSLIERVNLVARLAFDGKAAILALFNKDILLAARRGTTRQPLGEQKPASTATTTSPAAPA